MEQTKTKSSRKVLPPKPVKADVVVVAEDERTPAKAKRSPRKVLPPKITSLSIELPSPLLSTPTVVEHVESISPPIIVSEVQKVHLKRFEHEGNYYYRNSKTDELYEYLGSKKRGVYCGRYDILKGCIVKDAPESDYDD